MDFQTFPVCKVYYKKLYQTFCIPFSTNHLEYGLPLTLYFTDTQTLLKGIINSSTKVKKCWLGFLFQLCKLFQTIVFGFHFDSFLKTSSNCNL